MTFDTEVGVQRVISHLENLLVHKADLSSPFPLWEHLPPSHIFITDNMAHLVVPPLHLRVGNVAEMVQADDRVTARIRVRIRAILRALESYEMHTIHEAGAFRDDTIGQIADSGQQFLMCHLTPKNSFVFGIVTLEGVTTNSFGERELHYWREGKQGYDGQTEHLAEKWIHPSGSLRLVAFSEVTRLGLLQWDPRTE